MKRTPRVGEIWGNIRVPHDMYDKEVLILTGERLEWRYLDYVAPQHSEVDEFIEENEYRRDTEKRAFSNIIDLYYQEKEGQRLRIR